MSRLSRVYQKIFGSSAGANQISVFGSLFAGVPAFTTSPATAQSLANYLEGWFTAAIGGASPAIEDMNALFFIITYQLAYFQQAGMPEWDATTPYYTGSMAQDGSGNVYVSLTDNNVNNVLTDLTNWNKIIGPNQYPTIQKFTVSGTYTTPVGVKWIRVRMVGGGGGGGGGGATASNGGDGGATTFGTALLVANGGAGATNGGQNPGGGGSASLGTGPIGIALTGGGGSFGFVNQGSITGILGPGGPGAASPFGGAGGGGGANQDGGGGAFSNTGSGGGGGGASVAINQITGAGGAAGGYVDCIISAPLTGYTVVIGAGGAGGAAGSGGSNGGGGGTGLVLVEEHYV